MEGISATSKSPNLAMTTATGTAHPTQPHHHYTGLPGAIPGAIPGTCPSFLP